MGRISDEYRVRFGTVVGPGPDDIVWDDEAAAGDWAPFSCELCGSWVNDLSRLWDGMALWVAVRLTYLELVECDLSRLWDGLAAGAAMYWYEGEWPP